MNNYAHRLWYLTSFVASALTYLCIVGDSKSNGNAYGIYLTAAVLFNLLLFAALVVLSFAISTCGGFRWISKNSAVQLTIILTGLLLATATSMIGCVYNLGPVETIGPLKIYWRIAPVVLLALMVISSAILLFSKGGQLALLRLVRFSFVIIFVVSIMGIGTVGVHYLRIKSIDKDQPAKKLAVDTAYRTPTPKLRLEGCKNATRVSKFAI